MASTAYSSTVTGQKPVLCEMEVSELAQRLGHPVRRTLHLHADRYLRAQRWRKDSDRRAEVVFAMQDPNGYIWVHAKQHYPGNIFRLPSGGIHWHEGVEAALWREVAEETALPAEISRFLGVIEYCIHDGERTAEFASYIFVLRTKSGEPQPHAEEKISEFRRILPSQLRELAAELRNLIGDRRGWGQFRALSHDLVYEHLNG
jgi:ADP-ribose pyrophosphatase YjhB (NUDIX family)